MTTSHKYQDLFCSPSGRCGCNSIRGALRRDVPSPREAAGPCGALSVRTASSQSAPALTNLLLPHPGRQALDDLVCRHFAAVFTEKFQIDVLAHPRATLRLRQASERVRRVLSANADGRVALDCLVGDTDVSAPMTRAEFEALAEPLIRRAMGACTSALRASGISEGDLDAVELVGGCSRTPAFEAAVQATFGVAPSRTLNAEESVARGAALCAAMHSRGLRVRPCEVMEGLLHPAYVRWEKEAGGAPSGCHAIPRGTPLPVRKRITVRGRSAVRFTWGTGSGEEADEPIEEPASSASPAELSCSAVLPKARRGTATGAKRSLCVDVVVGTDQMPSISAFEVVESPHAEAAPDAVAPNTTSPEGHEAAVNAASAQVNNTDAEAGSTPDPASPEAAEAAEAAAPPPPPSTVTPLDTKVVSQLGLSEAALRTARGVEEQLQREDAEMEATSAAKNEFEAYLYHARAAVSERLSDFVDEDARVELSDRFERLEDWLYGDGEHETKGRYEGELAALRAELAPIEARARDYGALTDSLAALATAREKMGSKEPHASSAHINDYKDLLQQAAEMSAKAEAALAASDSKRTALSVSSEEVEKMIGRLNRLDQAVMHEAAEATAAANDGGSQEASQGAGMGDGAPGASAQDEEGTAPDDARGPHAEKTDGEQDKEEMASHEDEDIVL